MRVYACAGVINNREVHEDALGGDEDFWITGGSVICGTSGETAIGYLWGYLRMGFVNIGREYRNN